MINYENHNILRQCENEKEPKIILLNSVLNIQHFTKHQSSYVFTVILDLRSKTPVTQEFKIITLNPNILLNFTTPLIHHPFINDFS